MNTFYVSFLELWFHLYITSRHLNLKVYVAIMHGNIHVESIINKHKLWIMVLDVWRSYWIINGVFVWFFRDVRLVSVYTFTLSFLLHNTILFEGKVCARFNGKLLSVEYVSMTEVCVCLCGVWLWRWIMCSWKMKCGSKEVIVTCLLGLFECQNIFLGWMRLDFLVGHF